MERSLNPRVLQTKTLVHQALLSLLAAQDIHRISIRELCARAGINRTTFYNHYGSQYDVLREMSQWFLEDINATLASAQVSRREETLERVSLVLEYMQANRDLAMLLMTASDPAADFAAQLIALPRIEAMLGDALAWTQDPFTRENTVQFAVYGAYRFIQCWLERPQGRSAREAAALLLCLAEQVCHPAAASSSPGGKTAVPDASS